MVDRRRWLGIILLSRCRSRRARPARCRRAASSSTTSSRPGRKAAAPARARRAAVGGRRRAPQRPLTAGTPAFETAAAPTPRGTCAEAPHVVRMSAPHAGAAPGLGRRPHRLRRRLPDLPPDDSPAALPGIQRRLAIRRRPRRSSSAGGPAFYGDVQTVSESDLRRSELISLPLAALALLLVFGSVVAAALPARRRRRGRGRRAGGDLRGRQR